MRVWGEDEGRLCLAGRLDAYTVAQVRMALREAIDHGHGDLVVDLGRVEFLDGTGLGLLVAAHRRADRRGRRLLLRNPPERLSRMLAVTRLARILHVEHVVPA
jgi:anti-sigma B factor antagonist